MKKIALVSTILIAALLFGCAPQSPPTSSPTQETQPATITASSTPTQPPTQPATGTTPPATIAPTTPATSSPTPTQTPTPTPTPGPIYKPDAPPYVPTGAELELFQFVLGLINKDRQDAGVPPVTLDYNAAAQKHEQNMFDNFYVGHWGTDGLKPYMRYTVEGGLNCDEENDAYSGWYNPSENPNNYAPIDVRQEIQALQYEMVYNDASSNWAHKHTMLNKWSKKVSLGIVYDSRRVALVQQFQGDYLEYYQPPTITGNTLSLSGKFTQSGITIESISITYDAAPQPLSNSQLTTDPAYTDGYSLGNMLNYLVSPPPPGAVYTNLPPQAIVASQWYMTPAGDFFIKGDISPSLSQGNGVYTIVIFAKIDGQVINLTNYSIFVK